MFPSKSVVLVQKVDVMAARHVDEMSNIREPPPAQMGVRLNVCLVKSRDFWPRSENLNSGKCNVVEWVWFGTPCYK